MLARIWKSWNLYVCMVGGNVKWHSNYRKTVPKFYLKKILRPELLHHLAIPSLDIHPKDFRVRSQEVICTSTFAAALFTITIKKIDKINTRLARLMRERGER